ncbi:winged helix DNA-binding domain-containing protein [Streptomyces sp. NPDC005435]|uniref:winged helix DNA-binding domain-containing protein n=1 Tax=Streptomyces sp. NPDC005435 TaxID=3154464 RepID=UPI003452F784
MAHGRKWGKAMSDRVMSIRDLNRAVLERQLLLRRDERSVTEALGRLVALQAQVPNAPYVGLWSRLDGFGKADLTGPMERREVVRATLLRATLQVMTAEDYLRLRTSLRPALVKAMRGFMGRRAEGLDLDELAFEARELLDRRPYALGELGEALLTSYPERDAPALAYIALRCALPAVQRPPGGSWGSGSSAAYVTADAWLGAGGHGTEEPEELVRRHLAAFGPAHAKDIQVWSGLTGLAAVLKRMRGELTVLRDENGTELFDLPDAPLPDGDTPAPVRLLPEYDNLLLSHHDRTRVIPDEHRPRVFRPGGRVLPTVLLDGFVAGTWKTERQRSGTRLTVTLFAGVPRRDQDAVAGEAARLLEFITGEPGHPVELVTGS